VTHRQQLAIAFLLGFAAVYVLKYGIFGLELWDRTLHPQRLAPDTRANPVFAKPLLGLFGG